MKSALALKDRSRAVAAAAAPVTFSVPLADLTEFSTLPKARRTEVHFTLCVLEQLRCAHPQAVLHEGAIGPRSCRGQPVKCALLRPVWRRFARGRGRA